MKVHQYLSDFKNKFDKKLLEFLDKKEKQSEELDENYVEAILEIKSLIKAGGKRLRPFFVYTGYKACGGKSQDLVWRACMAIELIQAFALIHDDIMDDSSLRRGKQTCYKKVGLNKAILTGDIALILADELVPEKAKQYFDLLKFELACGQWLDVASSSEFRIQNLEFEEKVMRIMELKSARYTVVRPLQIGAALSAADAPLSGQQKRKILDAFFKYGENLGIAFQIQDDILGIFGDEKKVGKPVGSDISEGKKTLLSARLLEQDYKITRPQKLSMCGQARLQGKVKKFLSFFGKGKRLTKKQLDLTRSLMIKSGALKYCQEKASQLTKTAKRAIKNLEISKEEKVFLEEMCEYIVKRRY